MRSFRSVVSSLPFTSVEFHLCHFENEKKTISSGKTFHVYFTGFDRVYSIVGEIWLTTPITCFMYFPSIRPWLFIFDTMRVENVAPSMMNTYNCAIGNSQIFWFAIFAIKWTSMEREREREGVKRIQTERTEILSRMLKSGAIFRMADTYHSLPNAYVNFNVSFRIRCDFNFFVHSLSSRAFIQVRFMLICRFHFGKL